MSDSLIHDRGRGPELVGTRITVYNLLPYFLDATATESFLCRLYSLTPEQVSAARAYIMEHADTVLAEHLKIEARIEAGVAAARTPENAERARKSRETFEAYRKWVAGRPKPGPTEGHIPSFRTWFAEQEINRAAAS